MSQTPDFDSIKQLNPYGEEYWSARELAPLLGYNKWERFEVAIQRAMTACEQVGQIVQYHFPASSKMVKLGSKAQRELKDYNLSRFACYLVAQNGDPRKPEIAAELSAIDFKNVQTDEKLRRDQVSDEDEAIATHLYVGGEVRKAIEAIHAPMPETLPPAPSIRKMVEERRRAARKRRGKAEKQQDQPSLLDSGDGP